MNLIEKKCAPCEGGTPPLEGKEIQEYVKEVRGWDVKQDRVIEKNFSFKSFKEAMDFVNQVANIAEEEQHHPDIHIHYKRVVLELTTHAIKGLSENDFIMASKIDKMYNWKEKIEKVAVKKVFSIKFTLVMIVVLLIILLWQQF